MLSLFFLKGFLFILACGLAASMVGDGHLLCMHIVDDIHVPVREYADVLAK